MNELVKQMANDVIVAHPAMEQWVFTDEELNQFVRLIIQDCVEITQDWEWHANRYGVTKDILEHFGVEL